MSGGDPRKAALDELAKKWDCKPRSDIDIARDLLRVEPSNLDVTVRLPDDCAQPEHQLLSESSASAFAVPETQPQLNAASSSNEMLGLEQVCQAVLSRMLAGFKSEVHDMVVLESKAQCNMVIQNPNPYSQAVEVRFQKLEGQIDEAVETVEARLCRWQNIQEAQVTQQHLQRSDAFNSEALKTMSMLEERVKTVSEGALKKMMESERSPASPERGGNHEMVAHLVNRLADLENNFDHHRAFLKQFDPDQFERRLAILEVELTKLTGTLHEALMTRLPEAMLPQGSSQHSQKLSEKFEMQVAGVQEGLLNMLMDGLREQDRKIDAISRSSSAASSPKYKPPLR